MRRILLSTAWSPALNHPYAAPRQTAASSAAPPSRAFVNQYCVTCHNTRLKTGDLALDVIDPANIAANAEIWEKVVRKLRTGAMPPLGARRSDEATSRHTIDWLESELDRAAAANPNPGRPALHRLNRGCANAIRDLLDLDVEVASLLPP
jgi:cytochrome c5